MYSTCIFCTRSLGKNEALEHFPVGRRLAFDAAKGRLWVVCTYCGRWNLTPLEERWEAVEEAERLFRASPLRVSSDHIGLARIAEGMDLVRIGEPQRPELAAWRYGDQFLRRRHKYLVTAGATTVVGAAVVAGGVATGMGMWLTYAVGSRILKMGLRGLSTRVVARIHDPNGALIHVQRRHLLKTNIGIGKDGGFALNVDHGEHRTTRFEGADARRAASVLFPAVNRRGGSAGDVQLALDRVTRAGGAEQFLGVAAHLGAPLTRAGASYKSQFVRCFGNRGDDAGETGLLALSTTLGLAIEMSLHEEQERRALEGELSALETAWREAEEIGAIADGMFLPPGVEQALARLRRR